MMHRVRLAMQNDSPVQLGGKGKQVEVDEAFIGGKARNMHAASTRSQNGHDGQQSQDSRSRRP